MSLPPPRSLAIACLHFVGGRWSNVYVRFAERDPGEKVMPEVDTTKKVGVASLSWRVRVAIVGSLECTSL